MSIRNIFWTGRRNSQMKPDVVYTLDTPFIEWLEDIRRINVCPTGLKFCEDAHAANPNGTFGELLKNNPPKQKWAINMLISYKSQFDLGLRKLFMSYVKTPEGYYRLWKDLKDITNEERLLLRNNFRGKLPNIERKL